MRALVIGGTRNLGPSLVPALLQAGYQVAIFHRGITHADLPDQIETLHGDRSDQQQLRAAVGSREFDLVVDTTLYNGPDAQPVVDLFSGRIRRYVFISTGQVYLVRIGLQRPFQEQDYPGPVMAAPPESNALDYNNWIYGVEKRAAENVLVRGWEERKFPVTILRLPMVNSERDHYDRIYGYWLRVRDGGPILLPEGTDLPLRHVYGEDVIQAIMRLAPTNTGIGLAYNISQDETISLEEFLGALANVMGRPLRSARRPREKLYEAGLLPGCSPFSDPWMSSVNNSLSKIEIGMDYMPFSTYLAKLVRYFESRPERRIDGYSRRALELQFAGNTPSPSR
jgi:nucleoside-diphosphate-sugar epimerase